MRQFYLLRISCLVVSFILSIFAATASPDWQVAIMLASTAILLFGLIYELYSRYKAGEDLQVRVVCWELALTSITFFLGYILITWIFQKVVILNSLYATVNALNLTALYTYFYYLWSVYLRSRKNQNQEKNEQN